MCFFVFSTEVFCPVISAPVNGKITSCYTVVKGACTFECNNGYIMSSGDMVQTCNPDGQWSGSTPVCNGEYV